MKTLDTQKAQPAESGSGLNFAKPITGTAKELDSKGRAIVKAIHEIFDRSHGDLADLFGLMCSRLQKRYSLRRSTLFLYSNSPRSLKSYALWENETLSAGVLVTVPEDNSALWELIDTGFARSFTPARIFRGNVFEKKLTVGDESGALLLWPLMIERACQGLIAFNTETAQPLTASDPVLDQATTSLAEFILNS